MDVADFAKVEMRVGTVVAAETNAKARHPAYKLTIDFGPLGIRASSAQLTEHYSESDLIGQQIVAVTNLEPKRVAGVKSEVLVLASVGEDGTVLIAPTMKVANGAKIS